MTTVKVDVSDMPSKSIQIFLHPYLFEGNLEGMPDYIEVVAPEMGVFNAQIVKHMNAIERMCSGLNEEHIKYALMTSFMIVFLYSNKTVQGIMALNSEEDKLHVDIICTNSLQYKNTGTYLMNVANEIAIKLNKTTITLDAVEQAVPFYGRLGFTRVESQTIPMQKVVEQKPLQPLANTIAYRRSVRNKGGNKTRTRTRKNLKK